MPYKDKDKEREYRRAYHQAQYQAHREEQKAQSKAYYQAHKEEHNAKMKAWYQKHKEEHNAKMKAWYQKHKEEHNAKSKAWYQENKEEHNAKSKAWYQENKEEHKAYINADLNSLGQTKNSIRKRSSQYLFKTLKHTKLKGYEIHHCFGYDDYRNFIYIPKSLHLQIHQYLRDNHIDADTDHYNKIVHLIIACEDYVYIKA